MKPELVAPLFKLKMNIEKAMRGPQLADVAHVQVSNIHTVINLIRSFLYNYRIMEYDNVRETILGFIEPYEHILKEIKSREFSGSAYDLINQVLFAAQKHTIKFPDRTSIQTPFLISAPGSGDCFLFSFLMVGARDPRGFVPAIWPFQNELDPSELLIQTSTPPGGIINADDVHTLWLRREIIRLAHYIQDHYNPRREFNIPVQPVDPRFPFFSQNLIARRRRRSNGEIVYNEIDFNPLLNPGIWNEDAYESFISLASGIIRNTGILLINMRPEYRAITAILINPTMGYFYTVYYNGYNHYYYPIDNGCLTLLAAEAYIRELNGV